MARKASGADQVASARELLRTAKTADELRTAQAVLLPLELGLSLEMTAKVIGRSIGATCNLRMRYCKVARHERAAPRPKRSAIRWHHGKAFPVGAHHPNAVRFQCWSPLALLVIVLHVQRWLTAGAL